MIKRFILFAALVLPFVALPVAAFAQQCLVVGVADGDTLTARCGQPGNYEQLKIRLSGIDAPEKAQPFGQRSKQSLSDLCFGVEATITPKTIDRYKRTVADVSCRGQDVGEHQVRTGQAWVYVKYAKGYGALYPLEQAARAGRVGLWADLGSASEPVAPWEWRRNTPTKRMKNEPASPRTR